MRGRRAKSNTGTRMNGMKRMNADKKDEVGLAAVQDGRAILAQDGDLHLCVVAGMVWCGVATVAHDAMGVVLLRGKPESTP